MDDGDARERIGRVETLLDQVDTLADPRAQELATEVVQAMLELYGEGLARFVDLVAARDADGELATAVAGDELLSHLLILHGLHPQPLEDRVRMALDEVRPYLESHGGDVELLAIDEGIVRLRMQGSCSGCPSSTVTLKLAIEDAIHKAAPDVEGIEAEGTVEEPAAPASLLQIELSRPPREAWAPAGGVAELSDEAAVVREVEGEPLVLVRLGRAGAYAYKSGCPACAGSLGAAPVAGGALSCAACGARYDVRHAGRSLDAGGTALQPVPLLVDEAGEMKVAV
jgi:Fe-S cluster biogenesis protein NfuA/nitrite reductase/ring-hydroxylating ferredoxin subunit